MKSLCVNPCWASLTLLLGASACGDGATDSDLSATSAGSSGAASSLPSGPMASSPPPQSGANDPANSDDLGATLEPGTAADPEPGNESPGGDTPVGGNAEQAGVGPVNDEPVQEDLGNGGASGDQAGAQSEGAGGDAPSSIPEVAAQEDDADAGAGAGGQAGMPEETEEPPTDGPEGSCTMTGSWATVDPAVEGPYQVVTESNVGPMAGVEQDGAIPRFNLYRPSNPGDGGVCHPIITWGNGHGDRPQTYEVLIKQLVSHGFVVVASLSSNTSQGDPPPMLAGVTWMQEENENPESELYHTLDTTRIGATGHSEGGGATSSAGSDPRISTIAPIHGGGANPALDGPQLLLCGGQDTVAGCSRAEDSLANIAAQPVILAENRAADHNSWLSQNGIKGPTILAVTAWMRLHLMDDDSLKGMFYGPDCTLCGDTQTWRVVQKNMEE